MLKTRRRPGGYAAAFFVLLLGSCAPKHPDAAGRAPLVVFPPPPDTARIQFLTRISNSLDIEERRSRSFWRSLIGESEKEEEGQPIIKPYGIASRRGKIYVCDTILSGVEVIDLERRAFDYFQPKGIGALEKPINCFVDKREGNLYIADVDRGQVVVFDSAGVYLTAFGELQRIRPTDVFVDETRIWVSDIAGRVVRVYDRRTYRYVTSFPDTLADTRGRLFSPTNLYVTGDRVYVSDFGDFRVKVYSRDGRFLTSVGGYGKALGRFVRPKGIAVDRDSNLYVVDAGFENVQIFDREGRLLMFFGGPYEGPGNMWLPAKVIIDYDNLDYFREYVHDSFDLKYLILVTNQYGPDKISVYGFVEPKRGTDGTR
jgi:sugar lactone lactonase YvrE